MSNFSLLTWLTHYHAFQSPLQCGESLVSTPQTTVNHNNNAGDTLPTTAYRRGVHYLESYGSSIVFT